MPECNPVAAVLQRRAFPMFLCAVQHPDNTVGRWLAGVVVDALGLAMDRVHEPDYVARQVLRMLANGQAFLEGSEAAEPVYQRMLAEDTAALAHEQRVRTGAVEFAAKVEKQLSEARIKADNWDSLLNSVKECPRLLTWDSETDEFSSREADELAEARKDSERLREALSSAARNLYEASELLHGHALQACVYDSSMAALAAIDDARKEGK